MRKIGASLARTIIGTAAFATTALTQTTPLGPERFEKQVATYEAMDHAMAPPKGAILFIGDSQFLRWSTLHDDLPEYTIINRGVDAMQVSDVLHFADRLVIPYAPRMIVLHAGGNDVNNGKTPQQILADVQTLVTKVRARYPGIPFAFSGITPGPGRWTQAPQRKAANALIKSWVTSQKDMSFIDLWDPLLTANGQPREDIWVDDRVHPNHDGYLIRARIMRPILGKPDK